MSCFVVEPASIDAHQPVPQQERISYPKGDKAGTNHNQADNNDCKETGRSKIFAHDDTCASIGQNLW
jgi:hypothetical protein